VFEQCPPGCLSSCCLFINKWSGYRATFTGIIKTNQMTNIVQQSSKELATQLAMRISTHVHQCRLQWNDIIIRPAACES